MNIIEDTVRSLCIFLCEHSVFLMYIHKKSALHGEFRHPPHLCATPQMPAPTGTQGRAARPLRGVQRPALGRGRTAGLQLRQPAAGRPGIPGIDDDRTVVVSLSLPVARYGDGESRYRFMDELSTRLARLPERGGRGDSRQRAAQLCADPNASTRRRATRAARAGPNRSGRPGQRRRTNRRGDRAGAASAPPVSAEISGPHRPARRRPVSRRRPSSKGEPALREPVVRTGRGRRIAQCRLAGTDARA